MRVNRLAAWVLAALGSIFASQPVEAQVLVVPRRAQKTQVRRFNFDWLYVDLAAARSRDEAADRQAPASDPIAAPAEDEAGLRLYFYERERGIAELAIPLILDSYAYLVEKFEYTPSQRFPYILYNTYQEFLETRLFPIQEGTLGVTSPIDLTLTLPYFGDHRRFTEISTHELAHQFTIQKLRDVAKRREVGNPLEKFPLWFIEGVAEFYAQEGMDPETEMLTRDLVVNPDVQRGFALQGFFDDRPGSVLWTYKVGQARVAFLEETYGAGFTQRVLENAHLMSSRRPILGGGLDFPTLLERLTGEAKDRLALRFTDWLKRRAYRTYLEAEQSMSAFVPLDRDFGREPVLGLATSPDGDLLAYRRFNLTNGQVQLVLLDHRAPKRVEVVVGDGRPGVESLHPVSPRNFDLGDAALVFVAQADSRDVLYFHPLERRVAKLEPKRRDALSEPDPWWLTPAERARRRRYPQPDLPASDEGEWRVRLSVGDRIKYELGDLVAAESPSLSPDSSHIAFIGIDLDGVRDVYVLDRGAAFPRPQRLTNDLWAERQLSWGRDGIVFTSDATEHRKFNLFRVHPERPGEVTRLTYEDRDEFDPLVLPDGRVFFVAYDHGRADVHELVAGRIVRRTDAATGLTDIGPGPDGGLWGLWLHSGVRRPVRLDRRALLDLPAAAAGANGPPAPLAERTITAATDYDALAPKNWRLGPVVGLLGAGGGSVFGEVFASATDVMRDHGLILAASIYGELELTDGILLYLNQQHRTALGVGAFQSLTYYLDRTFPDITFSSLERFFGVMALARYPFSSFRYIEAQLALGGVRYFLEDFERIRLRQVGRLAAWLEENDNTWPQAQATLRLGYDTIRYHPLTGPFSGSSLLFEASLTAQAERNVAFGELRLDAAKYFAISGSANLFVRAGVGTSFGGTFARRFYLSSFDTLRGVQLGDPDYLLGRHFFFSTAELQIPLNAIVRVVFLPNLEGIAGLDFGGVADRYEDVWNQRVFNGVLGANFIFGPLMFRMHFAKPIDVGAEPPPGAEPLGDDWVTNLSLSWTYF